MDGPHCTSLSSFVLLEEGLGLSGLTSWVMTGVQEIYLQQSLGIYCFTRWDGHQGHSWTRFPHGSGLRELVLWVLLSGGPQRGSSSHSPFLGALGRASRYDQGHGERSVHTFVCEDTYLCDLCMEVADRSLLSKAHSQCIYTAVSKPRNSPADCH